MPQYKYPVKGGAKWMTKFNYTDPKSGIVKTAYKRGFDSKREAKKYEDDFIDSLIAPEEDEVEVITSSSTTKICINISCHLEKYL